MSRRNLPTFLYLKDEFAHIQSFLGSQLLFSGNGADGHSVGGAQSLGEFLLEYIAAGGIGAWFKSRPDALRRVTLAQGGKCLGDSGRVMAEIVNEGDTRFNPENLHPAADALE